MPNVQDEIADPKYLGDLLMAYRNHAQFMGWSLNQSERIVECTIPVRLTDARTVEVTDAWPNEPVWASGTLETYIGVPERFRDYWRQMAQIVRDNFDSYAPYTGHALGTNFVVSSGYRGGGNGEGERHDISGTEGAYLFYGTYDPASGLIEPEWKGTWPPGYTSKTVPQLIEALDLIPTSPLIVEPPVPGSGMGTSITSYFPDLEDNNNGNTNQNCEIELRVRVYNRTGSTVNVPVSANGTLVAGACPDVPGAFFWPSTLHKLIWVEIATTDGKPKTYDYQQRDFSIWFGDSPGVDPTFYSLARESLAVTHARDVPIEPLGWIEIIVKIYLNSTFNLSRFDSNGGGLNAAAGWQASPSFQISVADWSWEHTFPSV